MSEHPERPTRGGKVVDRTLRIRVRIFLLIFLGSLVIAVVDAVRIGFGAALPVAGAFLLAVAVGMVVSRMFALSWDTVNGRVIGRIDAIGAVILVGYVLLSVFRSTVVDLWFDGALVAAVSVAVLSGLMLGQVVGTVRGVRRIVGLALGGPDPAPA